MPNKGNIPVKDIYFTAFNLSFPTLNVNAFKKTLKGRRLQLSLLILIIIYIMMSAFTFMLMLELNIIYSYSIVILTTIAFIYETMTKD